MVDPNSKIRHSINTRPMELNVDVKETYNNKFMALMESACRPEPDGYFGATFGQPLTIHYAFKLETEPLANVLTLLDVVEDKVVDVILQNAFQIVYDAKNYLAPSRVVPNHGTSVLPTRKENVLRFFGAALLFYRPLEAIPIIISPLPNPFCDKNSCLADWLSIFKEMSCYYEFN